MFIAACPKAAKTIQKNYFFLRHINYNIDLIFFFFSTLLVY